MRNMLLLVSVTAGALSLTSFSPANAFPWNQGQMMTGYAGQSDIVMVKRSKAKPRPPGWSRGKASWKRGGRGVPPGQR